MPLQALHDVFDSEVLITSFAKATAALPDCILIFAYVREIVGVGPYLRASVIYTKGERHAAGTRLLP